MEHASAGIWRKTLEGYLSAFFEASRRDYYDALRAVSEQGDWGGWLHYFLNGIIRQSEDALSRAERINRAIVEGQQRVSGKSPAAAYNLVGLLAGNPYLTARKAQEMLGVAFNTANKAIALLESTGMVEQVGDAQRGRVYVARSLLDILEEPARLVGGKV